MEDKPAGSTMKSANQNNNGLNVLDKLKLSANDTYDQIRQSEGVRRLTDAVSSQIKILDSSVKSIVLGQKDKINTWIRSKIESSIIEFITKQKPVVAKKLKDPDMCGCVQRSVDSLVDDAWPLLIEEIQFQMRMSTAQPTVDVQQPRVSCICIPFHCIRSWYNYTTNPYDKTIWRSLKSFSWWIFTLISIFPYFGVQACFFIFKFLCMDKSDEYQLVNYILGYKKMQFISQGIIMSSLGYFLYFNCVSMISDSNVNSYLQCSNIGPGAGSNNIYDISLFLSQILFLWISFFMLPCSKAKGKARFKYVKPSEEEEVEQEKNNTCCCGACNWGHGGALLKFMIYDLFTFLVSIGVYFWTFNKSLAKDLDQSSAQIFMAKIVYGILSLPFLIFMLSPLQVLLTKSRATAYDRYGNTVPVDKRVAITYKVEDQNAPLASQISIDIEEIFN